MLWHLVCCDCVSFFTIFFFLHVLHQLSTYCYIPTPSIPIIHAHSATTYLIGVEAKTHAIPTVLDFTILSCISRSRVHLCTLTRSFLTWIHIKSQHWQFPGLDLRVPWLTLARLVEGKLVNMLGTLTQPLFNERLPIFHLGAYSEKGHFDFKPGFVITRALTLRFAYIYHV